MAGHVSVGSTRRPKKLHLQLPVVMFILILSLPASRADEATRRNATVAMTTAQMVHSGMDVSAVTAARAHHDNGNLTTVTPLSAHQRLLVAAFRQPEFQAALRVMTYCSPLLVAFGLVGNTLSLLVTLQTKNRRISCCTYMTALAVCDSGSLLSLLYYWSVTVVRPTLWSRSTCVAWVYVVFLMTAGSGFLLLAVTFDRFMAVCFPFRARTWCTPRRARRIVAAILFLVALLYIPMAAMSNVVDGNVCAAFRFDEWPRLNGALAVTNLLALPVVPFCIILVMNVAILRSVRRSHDLRGKAPVSRRVSAAWAGVDGSERGKYRGRLSSLSTSEIQQVSLEPVKSKRDDQLTVMLLVVSFTYLVIMLPISCRVVTYIFIDPYASAHAYAVFVLLFASLNHVLFLNNAINFYLYYLTGSRFRRDLRNLVSRILATGPCTGKRGEFQLNSMTSSSASKQPEQASSKEVAKETSVETSAYN